VLGSALAIKLLFGLPLWLGIILTAFDTVLVLGLKGQGFRAVEAIVLGLVLTIAACFIVQLIIAQPQLAAIIPGLVPAPDKLRDPHALYLAIGILGATVMPHNLYLHSSIVQTRVVAPTEPARREAIGFATADIVGALLLASLVNAAILILAATTFHATGNTTVADIEDAYKLLTPLTGAAIAAPLFAVALFASGHCGMWIDATVAGGLLFDKKTSSVADKVGFAPMPTGSFKGAPTWLWSWNLSIPTSSKQQEAARTFVAWATSKEYIELVAKENGWVAVPPGTRQSTYDNPEYKKAAPFADFVQKAISVANSTGQTKAPRPYEGAQFVAIPEYQGIGTQVGQTMAGTLSGQTTVDQGLKTAQASTERTMRQAGYPKK